MDRHRDVREAQSKAVAFLQQTLNLPPEKAYAITNFAVERGNPVREFFAAAIAPPEDARPASPTETVRPREKHSLFSKITRGRASGQSDNKVAAHTSRSGDVDATPEGINTDYFEAFFGDLPSARQVRKSRPENLPNASSSGHGGSGMFQNMPIPAKPSGSAKYSCIICRDSLSSKGVCKRHLEDQHVTPKVYQCEKCSLRFSVKAEAKKHSDACGKKLYSFVPVKPDAKKVYACEYTGHCFPSLPKYLDHLLTLCDKNDKRALTRSYHRKLFALLSQPGLRSTLQDLSRQLYGAPDAWQKLKWADPELFEAIDLLEYASIHEDGTIEFEKPLENMQKTLHVRKYLSELLTTAHSFGGQPISAQGQASGATTNHPLERVPSSSSSRGSDRAATPTQERPVGSSVQSQPAKWAMDSSGPSAVSSISVADTSEASTPADVKGKRHLSDDSRYVVPTRTPPGPSLTPDLGAEYQHIINHSTFAEDHSQPMPGNGSMISLPLRTQDSQHFVQNPPPIAMDQQMQDYDSSVAESVISSDAASELTYNSTLATSFQEPEALDSASFEYSNPHWWANPSPSTDYPFAFHGDGGFTTSAPTFFPAAAPSIRNSIATGDTFVEYGPVDDEKMAGYAQHLPLQPDISGRGAFFGTNGGE